MCAIHSLMFQEYALLALDVRHTVYLLGNDAISRYPCTTTIS